MGITWYKFLPGVSDFNFPKHCIYTKFILLAASVHCYLKGPYEMSLINTSLTCTYVDFPTCMYGA